ncbi:RNA polymerase II transcription elongation factor SpELL [Schizosaccharomyces cryophilus OY26]|uniref:RNA polymerase II transcription elongation factor SpELL n=1 Tax=Schizosaccharomyces cryophilus (strain OY26 / ATCC MYA-4695 / CBS 11777 / NBRC 106824 / NRRL Y48691) TaxID=653667 RepID=S9XKA8_SCHCR|nr:RNA polymerase II transcription elongation factor SpELL [Schizosaccharomyces cryophilus OY26]EPY54136.1 RNA polymerase II transcription elongation factor SpELL [Schizosaccharomyces cryophilus OY26]
MIRHNSIRDALPVTVDGTEEESPLLMSVQLPKEFLENHLSKNLENIHLNCTDSGVSVIAGGRSYTCTSIPETAPHEVYRLNDSRSLHLVGRVYQRLQLRREFDSRMAERVKSRTKEAQKEKDEKRIVALHDTGFNATKASRKPKPHRTTQKPFHRPLNSSAFPKSSAHNIPSSSVPIPSSSPTSPAGLPSDHPAVSSPSTSSSSLKNRLDLRTRVVQLLAVAAEQEDVLLQRTKASSAELRSLLPDIAWKNHQAKWELFPNIYKEVRVYDWRPYSVADRLTVIQRATSAFNELGLPQDAPERLSLASGKKSSNPLSKHNVDKRMSSTHVPTSSVLTPSFVDTNLPSSSTSHIILNSNPHPHNQKYPKSSSSTDSPPSSLQHKTSSNLSRTGSESSAVSISDTGNMSTPVSDIPSPTSSANYSNLSSPQGKRKMYSPSYSQFNARTGMHSSGDISDTSNLQQKQEQNVTKPKKRRQQRYTEEEMKALAMRFRETYPQYKDLYLKVSAFYNNNDTANPNFISLQGELISLHSQLKSWKNTLYAASDDLPT